MNWKENNNDYTNFQVWSFFCCFVALKGKLIKFKHKTVAYILDEKI